MSCLPCVSAPARRPRSLVLHQPLPAASPNPLRLASAAQGGDAEAFPAAREPAPSVVPEDEALTVKVVVRVRPLLDREKGSKETVSQSGPAALRVPDKDGGSQCFSFDSVLGSAATQADTYAQVGAQVLEKALQGFNATVFAYGQTGSGKTFAMEGSAGTARDASAASGGGVGGGGGIIPRLAEALFGAGVSGRCRGGSTLESLAVAAEYVEIYNERVQDLLASEEAEEEGLSIRQRADGEIYLEGATQRPCASAAALLALLAEGSARRARGETHMNAASSRSHAVLTLHLTLVWSGVPRSSKLHLIDLAGSERADATGARGERLKEGAQINKSLSALGGVIAALTTPGRAHVPYRDSKLTRLLQDSLGGNAVTVMLCCVSPSSASADETLSSLRFAERAKKVRNVAKVNLDPAAARLAALEGAARAAEERARVLEAALGRQLGHAWPSSAAAAQPSAEGRGAVDAEVARTLRDRAAAGGGLLEPTGGGAAQAGMGAQGSHHASSPASAKVAPAGGAQVRPAGCLPCCVQ